MAPRPFASLEYELSRRTHEARLANDHSRARVPGDRLPRRRADDARLGGARAAASARLRPGVLRHDGDGGGRGEQDDLRHRGAREPALEGAGGRLRLAAALGEPRRVTLPGRLRLTTEC